MEDKASEAQDRMGENVTSTGIPVLCAHLHQSALLVVVFVISTEQSEYHHDCWPAESS